jgi:hypothetical protein
VRAAVVGAMPAAARQWADTTLMSLISTEGPEQLVRLGLANIVLNIDQILLDPICSPALV